MNDEQKGNITGVVLGLGLLGLASWGLYQLFFKGENLSGVEVLVFKKTKLSDLKKGMKVAFGRSDPKIDSIKSIDMSSGTVYLKGGGEFYPDELYLLKK